MATRDFEVVGQELVQDLAQRVRHRRLEFGDRESLNRSMEEVLAPYPKSLYPHLESRVKDALVRMIIAKWSNPVSHERIRSAIIGSWTDKYDNY